jgi:thiol-disulfide isomerase/thioredoxin
MRDRYSIAVGLIFFAVVVVAVLHQSGSGSWALGLDPAPEHWPLPEFAVPSAHGSALEGDANVAQDDCDSSQLPCPDPRTPACRVEEPGALRVCDLFGKPSLISFWFTSDSDCVAQQDVVNRVYRRYRGRVSFLSLDVHDDPGKVRELTRERGWRMPVGYDRDGAVGALYHVGGCPTYAFSFPGGTLWRATIGELTPAQLSDHLDELLRKTRAVETGGGS